MARLLLWILFISLLALVAGWLSSHPGTMVLHWADWRVDTSATVLLAMVLTACALSVIAVLMVRTAVLLPRRLRQRRRERNYALGLRTATEGLVALSVGDLRTAHRLADKTRGYLKDAPLALLLSAQTAKAEGNEAALQRYLQTMLAHTETRFLAVRSLSDRCDRQGDIDTALTHAKQAHALYPADAGAAEALVSLYTRLSRWQEAEHVLRGYSLPRKERKRLRALIYMAQAERLQEHDQRELALSFARKAAELQPGFAPAAALAARLLAEAGQEAAALKLLKRAWKRTPHPQLADAFITVIGDMPPKVLLKTAERMAALQPEHVESKLLVARAALLARTWQTAEYALRGALMQEESARACRLMASLEREGYGHADIASDWDLRAISRTDGCWQCDVCGDAQPQWSAHCPSCRAFGHAVWNREKQRVHADQSAILMPTAIGL